MTFQEYLDGIDWYGSNFSLGQAAFNHLSDCNHALVGSIVGTNLDPFHNDEILPLFLEFVEEYWND